MIKNLVILVIMLFYIQSCSKKETENQNTNIDVIDSAKILDEIEKSEIIPSLSDDEIINNIIFQKKVKLLRVYVSKDDFGNNYYGINVLGTTINNKDSEVEFKEGKFQDNNIFIEKLAFSRMVSQKFNLDNKNKKLIIYTKGYNLNSKLVDGEILDMDISLLDYGILCIDKSIKPSSNYGNYCGIFIADNLDDSIISAYPGYLNNYFKSINNQQ